MRRWTAGCWRPTVALACIGLVMVASASLPMAEARGLPPLAPFLKHLVFVAAGTAAAAAMLRIDLGALERRGGLALLAALLLLPLVFVPGLGHEVNGAARWIRLGGVQLQVVEPVKLLLVIFLAAHVARQQPAFATRLAPSLLPLAAGGALVGAAAAAAGLRLRGPARRPGGGNALARRRPGALPAGAGAAGAAGAGLGGAERGLPAATAHRLPRSLGRSLPRRLPAHPGPDRGGARGVARGGPRRLGAEAVLPAGGPQRLHRRRAGGGVRLRRTGSR
ncbi:MAG: FtsW/RodA/SpoVE family cell cycle protein [Xanthomonadales bacterium]|nr:FtsW/RodA/SpoVE family cell cycle protein [Xanthomonadales bacterium]